MAILIFVFGMIVLMGAIALPDSKVRWVVILQNVLLLVGVSVMFSGFLLHI